jgi:hypothetical protein
MITYIQGGLGNQMFQYAAGLAVSKRLQEPLFLNNSFYEVNKSRQYELGVFPISATVSNEQGKRIEEKGFRYQDITESGMMVGYWQSEKYFADIADQVRKEFYLPKASIEDDMVAVTVRRGDYLSLPDVFHNLGESYYRDALEIFPGYTAVVFSDDPDWCTENLDWADYVMPCNTAITDLSLLSSFKNHIIANSSFGWWGAWLANGNTVVSPRDWFTNGLDTTDLIPDRWIRI